MLTENNNCSRRSWWYAYIRACLDRDLPCWARYTGLTRTRREIINLYSIAATLGRANYEAGVKGEETCETDLAAQKKANRIA
jgi:hypothetical protein